ncbi:hypothetical protein [Diaphorobacter sp. LR2014-1]|uniref:hypothetical protein n=1 Tax=Diaphorobacter sp. LR2014-1 TaxID=1933219 RepID=UPI000CDA901B|nr:hypothetical protein [Diaphorobacter sp. LR2014-1]POR10766.1 hypothetical protein BV908_08505 [Diaphorobacter sp. LR2014-1]
MSSGFLDSGLQALHSLSISTGVSEGQLLAGLVLFLGVVVVSAIIKSMIRIGLALLLIYLVYTLATAQ